jgi:hypothetical protein
MRAAPATTHVLDSSGDLIIETNDEGEDLGGIDTVQSSISFTLDDVLENLTLTGTAAINGTGNALANILTGNAGVNTLTGGAGDDIYVVQNTNDIIVEHNLEGDDTVRSSVSYTLGDYVERLVLTGTAAINGVGNTGSNVITGNAAATSSSAAPARLPERRRRHDSLNGAPATTPWSRFGQRHLLRRRQRRPRPRRKSQRRHRSRAVLGKLHPGKQHRKPHPVRRRRH